MADYDVIVIGAGNGGLTASAVLAQEGLKVLLLERHNIPGGCATSFCRGRFEFEVALHQLSGVGPPEKPGPVRGMLDKMSVLDDVEFVEMSDLYRVVLPNRFDMTLKAERSHAVSELQRQFPKEKEHIEKFFDFMYRYAGEVLSAHYFGDPDITHEKYPLLFRYAFKNTKEVLDEYFSDALLKAVLSVYWGYIGVPPSHMAFAWLAILFFAFLEFKPFHVKGGSQALSNAIVNRFLSYGGTVRFNCGAEKIIVEDGIVKGVVTEHGDQITTRYVVSNASKVTTYTRLIDPEQSPQDTLAEMRSSTIGPSAFTIYLGLDCEPDEIGLGESTNFIMSHTDIMDRSLNEMRQLEMGTELKVLSCYDIADPDFSPQGTCQVAVVTLKYADPWLRVPPSQYTQVKYRCADAMLRQIENVYPGLRDHIEEIEVATPLTHMRYLGHPKGAIYGFDRYIKDTLFTQPSAPSSIKGLYLVGGWVGDNGFQATLLSGATIANSLIMEHRG
jgi:prolycopene isomerase